MTDLTDRMVDIFLRSGAARSIVNPDRIRRDRIIDTAFAGSVLRPAALGAAASMTVSLTIPGPVTIGTAVALPTHIGTEAMIDRILAVAKTWPSTSEATFAVTANGAVVGMVSIPKGEPDNVSPRIDVPVSANSVLNLNAVTAGGAADVTVTVIYRPV